MASSSPERQFRAELFRTIVNYDDETTQLREKLELAEKELEAIKRSNSVGKSSSSPQDSVIELETRLNESIEAQTRLEVILSTLQTELDEKTKQCLEYQDMLGKMSASGAASDEDSMTRTLRIQELQEQLDEAQGQLEEYKLAQRPETQSALAEMQSKIEATNAQVCLCSFPSWNLFNLGLIGFNRFPMPRNTQRSLKPRTRV
ncbi:hypothetical protein BC629DRAFT_852697 [Irpex lacteus]|nr:hypothetical protein BC629DRAFT_852697 [Irpex lacteus]